MLKFDLTGCTVRWRLDHTPPPDAAGQPFALVSMGEFDCDGRYYTLRDGLPQGLLLYTLAGGGELEYQGVRAALAPGSLAVINCAERQFYRTGPGGRWHFRWMHFAGAGALQLEAAVNQGGLFAAAMAFDVFDGYWHDIRTAAQEMQPYAPHALALHLHRLLAGTLQCREEHRFREYAHQRPAVEVATAYMERHFRRPLRLEEIARAGSMSKYHFIKVFAQVRGVPPYRYLTTLRIAEAKRLLVTTDLAVAAVAARTGFSDAKTLIRSFKNTTGMTPLQFRKSSL